MKRMLVVSPIPTHPQDAGNRSRIFRMLTELKRKGYEIHFLYTGLDCFSEHVSSLPDYVRMDDAWDRFVYIPRLTSDQLASPFSGRNMRRQIQVSDDLDTNSGIWKLSSNPWLKNHLINCWVRGPNRFYRALSGIKSFFLKMVAHIPFIGESAQRILHSKNSMASGNMHLDSQCHPDAASIVSSLHEKYSYDVVMVEYVYMSCALEKLDSGVMKIIDTHDVFTDREKIYRESGIVEPSFSTTAHAECTGLARADVVVSIQEEERKHFARLCDHSRIVTIGHLIDLMQPVEVEDKPGNLFFAGTANSANVQGLKIFISRVLPEVRNRMPWVKLYIAGSISRALGSPADGCVYLGPVSNLHAAYANAHIVINPTAVGTGLKIKNIEALGYAKPLVTMSHGAKGLEKYAASFVTVEDYSEFPRAIIGLLEDKRWRSDLAHKAVRAAKKYNEGVLSALDSVFG